MRILSIETSCDETSIAIIEVQETDTTTDYTVLAHEIASQAALHSEYGGVFPMLAKREHEKAFIPLLEKALHRSGLFVDGITPTTDHTFSFLKLHDAQMTDAFRTFFDTATIPVIDLIVVTEGPGLEPALWVGINSAQTLAHAWNIPAIGANHMEGHILSVLVPQTGNKTFNTAKKSEDIFPAIALLVSGGHTELVLIKAWGAYQKIGTTRDDAVGEAFDKVARMLDLPYPGGPHISKLAKEARAKT